MNTTIFTKIIDSETLFIFEFYGDRESPYEQRACRKISGILTRRGFEEKRMSVPAGAYTKIYSMDFDSAMAKSMDNVAKIEKERADKKDAEQKAHAEYRAKAIAEMSNGSRGWYEVTMKYAVNDFHNGGHRWTYLNGRVIANNPYSAYLEGLKEIEKKHGFWAEEPYNAMIDYIGVLTDEYLMENE